MDIIYNEYHGQLLFAENLTLCMYALPQPTHTHREVAIRVGQALVDTKRLNIVTTDPYFRDDANLFLELVEAARSLSDNSEGPLLTDAPKWFLHLRDNEEIENQ